MTSTGKHYTLLARERAKRLQEPESARTLEHFGVKVRSGSKYGLHIDRVTYAQINKRSSFYFTREQNPALWDSLADIYEDENHRFYTDEWCEIEQADALENFELNMGYFSSLDPAEFDLAIVDTVTAQRGMVEVTDLNEWEGKCGLYLMVLDDYRQAYVGVTERDIKMRIREHWSSNKQFDRLLFGGVNRSILSIDSFRALDTTRIFALQVRNPFDLEDKVIESLPGKFLLNRVMGGGENILGFAMALGIDIIKKRDF